MFIDLHKYLRDGERRAVLDALSGESNSQQAMLSVIRYGVHAKKNWCHLCNRNFSARSLVLYFEGYRLHMTCFMRCLVLAASAVKPLQKKRRRSKRLQYVLKGE